MNIKRNPLIRAVAILIALLLLFPLYAKKEPGHNEDISRLFFVDQGYYNKNVSAENESRELNALTSGVHFCLDYMSGNESSGKRLLQNIENYGIDLAKFYKDYSPFIAVKSSFDTPLNALTEILITPRFNNGEYGISTSAGNMHEIYTHLGWDYYDRASSSSVEAQFFTYGTQWYARKLLYQKVVNKIFDFSIIDERNSVQQIEACLKNYGTNTTRLGFWDKANIWKKTKSSALASIFYYIHILSDIVGNEESTNMTRINLADLASDLEKNLTTLLGDTKYNSSSCNSIRSAISKGKNAKYVGFEKTQQFAQEILNAFHSEFAYLISDEGFYKNTELKKYMDKVQQIQ